MNRTLTLAALALALAACQQPAPAPAAGPASSPTDASNATPPQPAAPAPQDAVPAIGGPMLSFEPARMDACDPPIEAMVSWDATSVAGVERIEITTDSGLLFTLNGPVGQTPTGPWARPGVRLFLRNAETKEQLAEARIGGPVCNLE